MLINNNPVNQSDNNMPLASFSPTNFDSQIQTTLLEISHDAMSSLNLREVLSRISKQATKFLGVKGAVVALLDDEALIEFNRPELNGSFDYKTVIAQHISGKGLAGRAYLSGELAATSDYWQDKSFEHLPEIDQQIKRLQAIAILIIPISIQDKVIALITVSKNKPYNWTQADYWRAEQFASLAALAIQNARLFQQLEKHNQQMLAVQAFNRQLRGPIELKALAEHALKLSLEAVKAEGGLLYLVDTAAANELRLTAYTGFANVIEELDWFKIKAGVIGEVAQARQSVLAKNRTELLQQTGHELFELDESWQTALFVPLAVSDRLTGVIALLSNQANHFSPQRVEFIENIAGQIAVAIQQVSQIELYKDREQLAALLALAHTAAHELNQPLTVLQLELDMITEMGQKPDFEVFQRMQRAVGEITLRVRDYQRITRYHSTEVIEGLTFLDREKALEDQSVFYTTIIP